MRDGLLGTGTEWEVDERVKGSTAETARKRPERPWTAARTMEVLRRCPLAIAQRLVHCAIGHLPTHDLFWAKLRVQLHLPPLRSLDLLISPGTLSVFKVCTAKIWLYEVWSMLNHILTNWIRKKNKKKRKKEKKAVCERFVSNGNK